MKIKLFILCLCVTLLSFSVAAADRLVVACWNVENLFDTEDDPLNKGDDGYTPRGWMRWTEARYELKLQHLADVIAQMRPDILGLTEIENRGALEDLIRTLKKRHGYEMPYILHRDGDEKRGIDVAIISKHEAVATNWIQSATGQREVLAGDFVIGGRALTVLVNHWKSQLGKKDESDEMRRNEALTVRAYLDQRLTIDPAAAIMVAGDFNDMPESPILVEAAGFVLDELLVRGDPNGKLLYNLTGTLAEGQRGSYYYAPKQQWNTLDAIIVSRSMLTEVKPHASWGVIFDSYEIFKSEAQLDKEGHPLPFRRVRNKTVGDVYFTGYSDHFPVRVTLYAR
ncbi:MAG: endonuclease/exonuclease/phosphatase family protein [Kiritimatiellae bacterium]|nr:endonuclease/exonuclease/phosphatase family protein [Kiritimatiellia bacterium]